MEHHDILRLAVVGRGRMGREVEARAHEHGLEVVEHFDSSHPLGATPVIDFDVAIEFTTPAVVVDNILALLRLGRPVVVGTTGWHDRAGEIRTLVEQHRGRVIYASNFSIGVLTFMKVVREASRLFNTIDGYDAGVHEIHHTGKADAPSGTALAIARVMLEEIERKSSILGDASHGRIAPDALHVSSQRLGATVGTHTVAFDSEADTLELVHRAKNRAGFAIGALLAARWIVRQPPGLYRFEEVF
jgi:4-hydroxy-tetrahydrodipicolinate reductase